MADPAQIRHFCARELRQAFVHQGCTRVRPAIVGHVIGPVHLILYVSDQAAAAAFWQAVLDCPPALDVPGMTEFSLGAQVVLGLMP